MLGNSACRRCCQAWQQRLQALLPSIHDDPQQDPQVLNRMRERSDALLGLTA